MSNETRANKRGRVCGYIVLGLASLFTVCVAAQIFLAGLAVFTDPSYWRHHEVFVRIFELFPILMLLFAFIGRLPKSLHWLSAAIFVLICAQYFTAHVPGAGAFHPVIAAVLFWVALLAAAKAKRSLVPQQN